MTFKLLMTDIFFTLFICVMFLSFFCAYVSPSVVSWEQLPFLPSDLLTFTVIQ